MIYSVISFRSGDTAVAKAPGKGTQISDHAVSDGTYFLALIFGRMCERVLDQAADCLRE